MRVGNARIRHKNGRAEHGHKIADAVGHPRNRIAAFEIIVDVFYEPAQIQPNPGHHDHIK